MTDQTGIWGIFSQEMFEMYVSVPRLNLEAIVVK